MRIANFCFTLVTVAGVGGIVGTAIAGDVPAVETPATEPGVVPAGTQFVVRTSDTVSTRRAYRETIYEARLAENILDHNGNILVPKSSPVELGVRWFSFLGPGGAGMRELVLGVHGITVHGAYYPVATQGGAINGGLQDDIQNPEWLGGGGVEGGPVSTIGNRINVPQGALVAFRTKDPIRLKGYRR